MTHRRPLCLLAMMTIHLCSRQTLAQSTPPRPSTEGSATSRGSTTTIDDPPPSPAWGVVDAPVMHGELTCVTRRTAVTVHGRLVYLDLYPGMCRASMDAKADVLAERCKGQRSVDAAAASSMCEGRLQQQSARAWRPLEIAGLVVGAAALGYVAGKVLH